MHFINPEVIWQCQGWALTHHLTIDIEINNYMHITNNRSYITLKSESEYKMKYKEINNR